MARPCVKRRFRTRNFNGNVARVQSLWGPAEAALQSAHFVVVDSVHQRGHCIACRRAAAQRKRISHRGKVRLDDDAGDHVENDDGSAQLPKDVTAVQAGLRSDVTNTINVAMRANSAMGMKQQKHGSSTSGRQHTLR